MSMPPIDSPVSSFEVRCRVGQFVMDSDDPDRAPDLIAVGGTVEIEPDVRRPIRVHGENGPRVVGVDALTFTIDPATGKLVHPDGEPGVELIDPTDEHLDPQGWTYTAQVRPEKGRSWSVTFGAPTAGDVVDLGGIVSVAPSPGVTENYMQQTLTARDEAETFAVRAETAATEAEDYAPSFDWDGTRLVIDGETGPDLQGPPVAGIDDVPGLRGALDGKSDDLTFSRTIPEEDLLNGWKYYSTAPLTIHRDGRLVTLVIPSLTLDGADATGGPFLALPSGLRVDSRGNYGGLGWVSHSGSPVAITKNFTQIACTARGQINGILTWVTSDPWPTTLPGDPA